MTLSLCRDFLVYGVELTGTFIFLSSILTVVNNKMDFAPGLIGMVLAAVIVWGGHISGGLKYSLLVACVVPPVIAGSFHFKCFAFVILRTCCPGYKTPGHFNPAVSVMFWLNKSIEPQELAGYVASQVAGAVLAHLFVGFQKVKVP